MPDRHVIVEKTISYLKDNLRKPADIGSHLSRISFEHDVVPSVLVNEFFQYMKDSKYKSKIESPFGLMVAQWDHQRTSTWSDKTEPHTRERRNLIYQKLNLSKIYSDMLDEMCPIAPVHEQPIIIAANDPDGFGWYQSHRERKRFYWDNYSEYLLVKNWDKNNIAVLNSTTDDVMHFIGDPFDVGGTVKKGLVVGYVQSGKTANFTGLIAKSIDAGYRLIIVLAGLQNTLRNQTQRRLDKELVGTNVLSGTNEYNAADDWLQFQSYDDNPRNLGSVDILRLTSSIIDFQNVLGDVSRLYFSKQDIQKPFCSPENADVHAVKLIVIKKNKTTLTNLANALDRAIKSGVHLDEVPSLIIDDESDQASLNTVKQTRQEKVKRSAINGLIVRIINILKRPKYVGYTATPFANVFVNPDDAEDLFPSDFILSLPRPDGYMGVSDFYDDIDAQKMEADPKTRYGSYIRAVKGDDLDADGRNLVRAIDSFVLSAAIKIFRENCSDKIFKHHTMLVHNSHLQTEHARIRDTIIDLFENSGYITGGPGLSRLKKLWDEDFNPVSSYLKHEGFSAPKSFMEIKKCLGEAIKRIRAGDVNQRCAVIVNGDNAGDEPDFDSRRVWKIIVGGTKLSRGFTVEDLTISYYRRVSKSSDTLMQMGRWFGYRKGYQDLVRLFIGTDEPINKKGDTTDLYEDFRSVCYEEEEFRDQLERYSRLKGDERLLPMHVPPLVPSYRLQPSAKNKMYNAEVIFINFKNETKHMTNAPSGKSRADIEYNSDLAIKFINKSASLINGKFEFSIDGKLFSVRAAVARVGNDEMVRFIDKYRYGDFDGGKFKGQWTLIGEFISKKHGDHGIKNWVLLLPIIEKGVFFSKKWQINEDVEIPYHERSRSDDKKSAPYKAITGSSHVKLAEVFSKQKYADNANELVKNYINDNQGVCLIYPVLDFKHESKQPAPSITFALSFPDNKIQRQIKYGVKVKSLKDAPVVDSS